MKNSIKKQIILVVSLLTMNASLHAMQKDAVSCGLEKLIQSASNSTVWNYCCKPLEYAARAYQESNYLAHSHPIYHHNDNKTLEAAVSLAGKLQGPAPKRLVARTKAPLTSQTTSVQKFTNSSVQTDATNTNSEFIPALQQVTQPNLQSFTSKNRLNKIAVEQGYGFKTANLKVLTDLAQHKKLQNLPGGYNVEVPAFVGVSHEQTSELLKAQGLDINQEWNKILKLITPEEKSEFKLSEEFIAGIEALSQKIEEAFEKTAQEAKSLNNPALNKLIKTCADNKSYITTRSTGREDTEELANAGGNASVEIVTPTTENVIRGMGAVISSYFKHKSFSQRATAKDSKLFDVPLMPVLVQTVVGETPGNPVSGCVSYTQEAQSNSENLAISQCTHGHTKSVVDNMNPVDSYYHVHSTGKTYSVIKQKLQRQAPTIKDNGKFGLTQTNNSKQEASSSSLTQEEQQALAQTLQFVEKAYGKVMDLELLIDHNKKIIYLFQARPLVIKKPNTPPSYVKDLNLFEQNTITQALKMSEAGGSIRHITSANQVLTGPTLDDALAKYLQTRDTSFDVVIVQEKAEATSHAAAVFNGLGKAMLVVKNVHDIEEKLKQGPINLLIDVQRGKIIDLKDQSFEALKNKEIIKQGRFNHPLPSIVSIPRNKAPQKLLSFYHEQEDQLTQATLDDLLEALKEGSETNVQHAQLSILTRLAHEIKEKQAVLACNDHELCPMRKETAQQAATALERIFAQACKLSEHIEKTAHREARSLERLLPITFLEALLKQIPQESLVDVYSYESVLKKHNDFVSFVTKRVVPLVTPQTSDAKINLYENKQCPATILQNVALLEVAQQGVEAAFTKTTEDSWIQFVSNLDTQKHKQLFEMTETIEKLEMFPLWITLIFPAHAQERNGFDKLYADYKQDSAFLKTLKEKKDILNTTDFSAWNDPKNFNVLKDEFSDNLYNWFKNNKVLFEILNTPENHSFAFTASTSTMHRFVETFDQILKVIKGNPHLNLSEKMNHFTKLLTMSHELFYYWYLNLYKKYMFSTIYGEANIAYHYYKTIDNYKIHGPKETSLLASESFIVQPLLVTSTTDYLVTKKPETFEDFFTFFHQNQLALISILNQKIVSPKNDLPQKIENITKYIYEAKPMGTFFKKGLLKKTFNIPLRQHSMEIGCIFNKKNETLEVRINTYGNTEFNRFQYQEYISDLYAKKFNLRLIKNFSNNFKHELILKFNKNENLMLLPKIINLIKKTSFSCAAEKRCNKLEPNIINPIYNLADRELFLQNESLSKDKKELYFALELSLDKEPSKLLEKMNIVLKSKLFIPAINCLLNRTYLRKEPLLKMITVFLNQPGILKNKTIVSILENVFRTYKDYPKIETLQLLCKVLDNINLLSKNLQEAIFNFAIEFCKDPKNHHHRLEIILAITEKSNILNQNIGRKIEVLWWNLIQEENIFDFYKHSFFENILNNPKIYSQQLINFIRKKIS